MDSVWYFVTFGFDGFYYMCVDLKIKCGFFCEIVAATFKVAFWVVGLFFSCLNLAFCADDCFDGSLITKEMVGYDGESLYFTFSEKCDGSKMLHNNQRSVHVFLPVFHETLVSEGAIPSQDKIKSILTIRPGAARSMLVGMSDSIREKSTYLKSFSGYKIYRNKLSGVEYESIFHQENKDFFVECTKSFCGVEGIDLKHQVSYSYQIFDVRFRNWELIHKLVFEFIEKSYRKGEKI